MPLIPTSDCGDARFASSKAGFFSAQASRGGPLPSKIAGKGKHSVNLQAVQPLHEANEHAYTGQTEPRTRRRGTLPELNRSTQARAAMEYRNVAVNTPRT